MSRRPEQQVVWQSGRRRLALAGWFLFILGNSILLMGNADVLIDYSFHKELLARLPVGHTTAGDIRQLLG